MDETKFFEYEFSLDEIQSLQFNVQKVVLNYLFESVFKYLYDNKTNIFKFNFNTFMCPISHDYFKNPVSYDGYFFEEACIVKHLETSNKNPMNNNIVNHKILNYSTLFEKILAAFYKMHPEYLDEQFNMIYYNIDEYIKIIESNTFHEHVDSAEILFGVLMTYLANHEDNHINHVVLSPSSLEFMFTNISQELLNSRDTCENYFIHYIMSYISDVKSFDIVIKHKNKINFNVCNEDGYTPLHILCSFNLVIKNFMEYKYMMHEYMKFDFDINAYDEDMWSPLHLLCSDSTKLDGDMDHLKLIKLLIDNGADVNCENTDNQTPFFLIASDCSKFRNMMQCVAIEYFLGDKIIEDPIQFINNNRVIDVTNCYNHLSPFRKVNLTTINQDIVPTICSNFNFLYNCQKHIIQIFMFINDSKCDFNYKCDALNNSTAIHSICSDQNYLNPKDKYDILNQLFSMQRIDVNCRNKYNLSPFDILLLFGDGYNDFIKCVSLFLNNNVNIATYDKNGNSYGHYLAYNRDITKRVKQDVYALFTQYGLDMTIKNSAGLSVSDILIMIESDISTMGIVKFN
jgi:hypothetical protein